MPRNLEMAHSWRGLLLSRAKLKASAKTSALLAGFAMVAMVELQLNNDEENPVPGALLIIFGICTVLLVSVHLLALMISTCILPHIEAVALGENHDAEAIKESPHERMHFFIETAWMLSNVFGIFLFLAEMLVLCWVRFWEMGVPHGQTGKRAALYSTIVLVPVIIVFIAFATHFYQNLTRHRYERSIKRFRELETIANQLDVTRNVRLEASSASMSSLQMYKTPRVIEA